MKEEKPVEAGSNFIRDIIKEDLASGKHTKIITRFPPEPNGYLHIGHATAFLLSFSLAEEFGGECNLRFDDTNPVKEDAEFVEAIKKDIQWTGCDWGDRLHFASDYFDQLYEWAVGLINEGKAYVDHLSPEEMRKYRGTLTEPGKNSPHRDRTVGENLELFEKMKSGGFEEGECVLRAKIDMASPNLPMRDPTIYRIRKVPHHRTGDKWCIYPMYDYTHCLSDAIEGVTHSLCSLEFENQRPLYDWFIDNVPVPAKPHQYEFARFNITYTIMSKRNLLKLVEENHVSGWDDPRMPTLSGLRRRGYTPGSIRTFREKAGVARSPKTVDVALLEYCLRDELNAIAQRRMVVLDPVKLVITNYPEDQVEQMEADNNPENEADGKRTIPFSRERYIEREDFRAEAPKKFFRMVPGREVRLKHGYYVNCEKAVKNDAGEITEIHCTYDPQSRGGWTDDGRRVKGTLHWVSAEHAVPVEVRKYDRLFSVENPAKAPEGKDFTDNLNPDSLTVLNGCLAEPGMEASKPGDRFQFLRQGYFCTDTDATKEKPVFNQTVGLRDSWAKKEKKK